jgi:hypothetical protein
MSYTPDPSLNVAIDVQARLIAEELRRRGMSFGNRTPAQALHRFDGPTGELVVGLTIGDLTYHEVNGELIVQREAKGGSNGRASATTANRSSRGKA